MQGRELVVVDAGEVDDDLVRDMTEILTGMCARLYGKRAQPTEPTRAMALPMMVRRPDGEVRDS